MQELIAQTLKDIFSRDVLPFILIVGIGSVLFWIVPLWWLWDGLISIIEWLAHLLPWTRNWSASADITSFWSVLKVGYVLVTITVSIATAVWGEGILRRLVYRHYPDLGATGESRIHRSLYYNLKANGIFVLLLIITFPILFVPYVGKMWLLYLWSIQIKEPTVYDVGALLNLDRRQLGYYTKRSRTISLIAAALNFIPIVNFFVPLFAQILFLHSIMMERT
jgi:hypothetical protein